MTAPGHTKSVTPASPAWPNLPILELRQQRLALGWEGAGSQDVQAVRSSTLETATERSQAKVPSSEKLTQGANWPAFRKNVVHLPGPLRRPGGRGRAVLLESKLPKSVQSSLSSLRVTKSPTKCGAIRRGRGAGQTDGYSGQQKAAVLDILQRSSRCGTMG